MRSRPVALLLADLGVERTHSRPRAPDDNPYSESQSRTLRHRPDFPARFGSPEDARAFLGPFSDWHNTGHRHSGTGLLTPAVVHAGLAEQIAAERAITLTRACATHPERFVRHAPRPPEIPTAVWTDPPKPKEEPTQ